MWQQHKGTNYTNTITALLLHRQSHHHHHHHHYHYHHHLQQQQRRSSTVERRSLSLDSTSCLLHSYSASPTLHTLPHPPSLCPAPSVPHFPFQHPYFLHLRRTTHPSHCQPFPFLRHSCFPQLIPIAYLFPSLSLVPCRSLSSSSQPDL
ncbi:hypothetical protein E2C01_049788 [Portunus trituberculatus]|uniref:Uncharacterized protein n=1 Tax=Portunus trituberculatus TaxID=210409 RepID=A0A5B7GET1_PORTR|nr:hypothetical protein [Portunus trituberculatus]